MSGGGMGQPGGMYGRGQAGGAMTAHPPMRGQRGMRADNPSEPPSQPFSNLNLPNQNVGNGAYNGGGMVLEYMPDGSVRVVPPR